ncbi:RING-type domain-containing protein [Entamoeba marina]
MQSTTYFCNNCNRKYNRSRAFLVCPFCLSEAVEELPLQLFKTQPLPSHEMYKRAHYHTDFDQFSNDEFVDFPSIPQGGIPFHPGNFGGSDLYLPQPNKGGPMQIYPRNPYTGSSRPPQIGMFDVGNHGEFGFDAHGDYPTNLYPPMHPQQQSPLQVHHENPTTSQCVFCNRSLKNEDDVITMTCSHKSHAECVRKGECPICSSIYS